MKHKIFLGLLFASLTQVVLGAGFDAGDVEKSDLNLIAIALFVLFVLATLSITYFSSKKSKSADGFYTAGGNITGMQNGIAIAGDYMSAASFL